MNWASASCELEAEAYEIAGQPFNLAQPQAARRDLLRQAGPAGDQEDRDRRAQHRRGGAGEAGRGLSPAGQAARAPLLSKLKGTYTDKLASMAHPRTGRVHTHYAQAVAVTGRLASNEPNLQNIPVRTPEGRRVREAFVAPAGPP